MNNGLGKPRSKLGAFLDRTGKKQKWLQEESGVSRHEVTDLCDGKKNIRPRAETAQKVISSLRKHGHDVKADDFW